jgi:hypothetical protein
MNQPNQMKKQQMNQPKKKGEELKKSPQSTKSLKPS